MARHTNINRLQKHKQTAEWHSQIVQPNPLPSPPVAPTSRRYRPLGLDCQATHRHKGLRIAEELRASLPSTPCPELSLLCPPSLSLSFSLSVSLYLSLCLSLSLSILSLTYLDQFGTCPTNPLGPSGRNHNMRGPSRGCSGGKAPLL